MISVSSAANHHCGILTFYTISFGILECEVCLSLLCKQWFLQVARYATKPQRNHCEHPSSSLIEPPSSAMNE